MARARRWGELHACEYVARSCHASCVGKAGVSSQDVVVPAVMSGWPTVSCVTVSMSTSGPESGSATDRLRPSVLPRLLEHRHWVQFPRFPCVQ